MLPSWYTQRSVDVALQQLRQDVEANQKPADFDSFECSQAYVEWRNEQPEAEKES